jgi:hypothetical protein
MDNTNSRKIRDNTGRDVTCGWGGDPEARREHAARQRAQREEIADKSDKSGKSGKSGTGKSA